MTIGRGFAQVYSNGKPYTISDPSFKVIGQGYFLGIPVPIILLVIAHLYASVDSWTILEVPLGQTGW